jgi:hypothetical protein
MRSHGLNFGAYLWSEMSILFIGNLKVNSKSMRFLETLSLQIQINNGFPKTTYIKQLHTILAALLKGDSTYLRPLHPLLSPYRRN